MPKDILHAFDAWAIFCQVIATGSVTQAARDLNMDAGQASRLLRALEAGVGQTLVDRTHRPLSATTFGEELFEEMSPVVRAFEDALQRRFPDGIQKESQADRDIIRISAFQGYAHEILPPLLERYMAEHPNISFAVLQERSLDDLERGTVDVFETANVVNRSTLIRFDTREIPCILACSPEYLRRHGRPEKPEDLALHVGLERIGANFPESKARFFCGRRSVQATFQQVLYSDNSVALRDSAVKGLGIVYDLPVEVMREQILAGDLVQVLPGWHRAAFHRSILISKSAAAQRPEVREFALWLAQTERLESFRRELEVFAFLKQSARSYY